MKSKYFILRFIFISLLIAITQEESPRLLDYNNSISENDYKELSEIINKNELFIIRFIKEYDFYNKEVSFFEASTLNFFKENCEKYKDFCDYGYIIDVYIGENIFIIQAGIETKKLIDDVINKRIINSLRSELTSKNWKEAIKKTIVFINYFNNGGKLRFFPDKSDDPLYFIFYKFIPLFCLFLLLGSILLYYLAKANIIGREANSFLTEVLNKWNQIYIKYEKEKILSPGKKLEDVKLNLDQYICIFCWKPTNNKLEYFMYCGHSYHEKCLRRWNLYAYSCCPCSQTFKKDECLNRKEFPEQIFINSNDIKILLRYCTEAFKAENIFEFCIQNEKKIEEYNNINDATFLDTCHIPYYEFKKYKDHRLLQKFYRMIKMSCVFLIFYPEFLKLPKVKAISKLIKIKKGGYKEVDKLLNSNSKNNLKF